MWEKTVFRPIAWAAVALVWLSVAAAAAALTSTMGNGRAGAGPWGAAGLALSVGASALALKLLAEPFTWRPAGAFALMLAAAVWGTQLALGLVARQGRADGWEGIRLGLAQCAAFLAEDTELYPSAPDRATVGANKFGGLGALARFTGEILGGARGAP
jgi:hypothetical protein